jgi:hypothetical protein
MVSIADLMGKKCKNLMMAIGVQPNDKNNGFTSKQMLSIADLMGKKCKNLIMAIGVQPKDKICSINRARRSNGENPLEAPGLDQAR